jgi:photosystem II stability/assembly factor-like uncharacterized protein
MNDDRRHDSTEFGDLEDLLRNHYGEVGRTSSIALTRRIGAELDRRSDRRSAFSLPIGRIHSDNGTVTPRDAETARRPRAGLQAGHAIWGALRVATTVAAAVALLAVLVLPRLGLPGPAAGPTFDPAAAERASVDAAGTMRNGGIWVSAGAYILTSTDGGVTWRAMARPVKEWWGRIPVNANYPYVLDPEHVWIAGMAQSYSADPPMWQLVLTRTADGGRTWRDTVVWIPQDCTLRNLFFEDASHGFLVCLADAAQTVLRTIDGGASWEVVSRLDGLGRALTASDASTLWSARDRLDPEDLSVPRRSIELRVSRDAGATWSTVDLPGLASITDKHGAWTPNAGVVGGPTFVDATHGALAIADQNDPTTLWIYATEDAGRTWTRTTVPADGAGPYSQRVSLGHVWAVAAGPTVGGLITSVDSGATWTDVAGLGAPEARYYWIDFADRNRAAALIDYNPDDDYPKIGPLMLSSDGGRTWHPADFGNARAAVPADAVLDPIAAQEIANDFENIARRTATAYSQGPQLKAGAWKLLSPYSQQAFGTYGDFVVAERSIQNCCGDAIGDAVREPELSAEYLGADLWRDLTAHADMPRAYVVHVQFRDTAVAPETLVVAPLSSTGEWRIWVVMK